MAITGLLTLIVLIGGAAVYFICCGLSKATVGDLCKWFSVAAMLAFLMAAGSQSCSMGVGSGGGGSAQHR
jgi:hypothetical protein